MNRSLCRSAMAALIVALALVLAGFVLAGDRAWAATSGDCGETAETVSFNIDAEGTMTISGAGAIKQQTKAGNYPWYADRTKVKKLVLGEGVTNAPNSAFYGMTNLKNVELPSTLDTWGTNVFQSPNNVETIQVTEGGAFSAENNILFGGNKTRLILSAKNVSGEINLPATLETIDDYGLYGRSEITALTLPNGLTTIGNNAFRGLKKVETLEIPATVTSIGTNAFQNMESLKAAAIPAGITTLSNYIFTGDKALATVSLPAGLTGIGTNAFQNCVALTGLEIPATVTSIGNSAFAGCTGLEALALPDGLTTLGTSVFSDCSSLQSMTIPAGITTLGTAKNSSMFLNCAALESVSLPDGLTTIGGSCFKGCSALGSIDIPATVTTIGGMAFQQCIALEEVTVPAGVKELTGTFAGCTSLRKIVLPDGLTTLAQGGQGASMVGPFTGCAALEEISVPAGVTSIPKDTFSGCTSLKDLGLTNGVTSIRQNAYYGCTSLEDITIPGTVTTVMGGAFENCENLTRLRLGDGMTQFNTGNKSATTAFKNCNRLTDIYLPDSLEGFNPITMEQADSIQRIHVSEDGHFTVEDNVLYDKPQTKLIYIPASYSGKLVLPETVVETGARCAGYTHALTEVVFPEGFKTVGESAFYYAYGLQKVTLPSTLESIGASGFRATGLRSIEIPDSVTSVGSKAFNLCEKMTSAKLGSGITAIPQDMFLNCYKLADVNIPAGVTDIGSQAFSGTCVPEITVPDGCQKVQATAFANNTNLSQVILPASLTSIPSTAFKDDTGLKYIYYKGTADQWAALRCIPAYGTVITDYKGVDGELASAVIATQPEGATYQKGADPAALQVTVTPTGEEGEQFFYTWYSNTTGKAEGGTTVAGTAIENGSSCMPTTDKIGSIYYYCVVTRMVNGFTAESTVSDVAKITVKIPTAGAGTEDDPFIVENVDDLKALYNAVKEGNTLEGTVIRMTADIILPDDWDPIGVLKEGETQSAQGKNVNPFSGTFDGDGHTITVPEGGKPLFGYVRNATIQNLNIYGTRIEGTGLVDHYERDYETGSSQSEFGSDAKYIATISNVTLKAGTKTRESGLIGENNNSQDASSMNPVQIVNCKAEKGVEIGYNHDESQIGTFAGRICGTIINCVSDADVYGTDRVGGIAGCQDVAMGILHVVNSSFHGTVHATGNFVGGILGSGYPDKSAPNALCVEIRNCHADGTVNGQDYVGGIFGAEDTVAQCWGNGIGYIYNNLFTGTIQASKSARFVGGVIGYYRSLNKYTNFGDNHYAEGCGAAVGIGGAQIVDTNAKHETDSDIIYVNTENSVANCPAVPGCTWQQGLNRTDDPFGMDATALAAGHDAETISSQEFLSALNDAESGMHNWVAGTDGKPCISQDPVCYKLELSGNYKDEYILGEEFDTTGMEFTATWTDGKVTKPAASEIKFRGFDKDVQAVQTVEASYGSAATSFVVKVLKKDEGQKIEVSLVVLGDDRHGDKGEIHTNKMGELQTWIAKKTYEIGINDTAMDVLQTALKENGYRAKVSGGYVSGIVKPDGDTLKEFSNGTYSGWMYTCNGEHPQLMLPEKYLEDGDELVFHYTDEYRLEEDSLDVSDVKAVRKAIDDLPAAAALTLEDEEAVTAATEAFEGLNELKAKLITKPQREKLAEDQSRMMVLKTADEADKAVAAAETTAQELAEANTKAAESKAAAEEAAETPGRAAVKAARTALKDAQAAAEKAAAYEEAAQAAVDAWAAAEKAAKDDGDAQAEAAAKAAGQTAKDVLDTAKEAKAAADQALKDASDAQDRAILDKEAHEADLQEAKELAITALEQIVSDNQGAADADKLEIAMMKAVDKIRSAENEQAIVDALAAGQSAINTLVQEKAAADAAQAAADAAQAEADAAAQAAAAALANAKQQAIADIQQSLEESMKNLDEIGQIKAQLAAMQAIANIKEADNAEAIAAQVETATKAVDKLVEDKKAADKKTAEDKAAAEKAAAEKAAAEKAAPPAPAKVTLTKAKKGKKKATITWKRVAKNATGYQIQFVNKKTGDVAKTVEVKQSNKAKIKVVVKPLKKGKYIVKVRACNTVKGKTSYGTWSNARKVKVR